MSSRRSNNLQMRAQLVALHEQGLNFSEISRETGVNVSNHCNAILFCLIQIVVCPVRVSIIKV